MPKHQLDTHFGGWRPSLPDHRDLEFDATSQPIAAEVDPRPNMPAVYNQGQLGSCTANAVAAAMEYDLHLDGHGGTTFRGIKPSRLLIYYCERQIEGDLGQGDTGAEGRDGFKALQTYGWVPESEWPYEISKFQDDPPAAVWAKALENKLTKQYAAVAQTQAAIQAALSNNQTVAFGFTVYESFESSEVASTGIVPMPAKGESTLGGHEVLCVGYLEEQPAYALVRNSWGAGWGMDGYFLMPWTYLLNPRLASDHRTIVRS